MDTRGGVPECLFQGRKSPSIAHLALAPTKIGRVHDSLHGLNGNIAISLHSFFHMTVILRRQRSAKRKYPGQLDLLNFP